MMRYQVQKSGEYLLIAFSTNPISMPFSSTGILINLAPSFSKVVWAIANWFSHQDIISGFNESSSQVDAHLSTPGNCYLSFRRLNALEVYKSLINDALSTP